MRKTLRQTVNVPEQIDPSWISSSPHEMVRVLLSAVNAREFCWSLLVVLLVGCSTRQEEATTHLGPTPVSPGNASSATADPQAAFIAAYRKASERKEIGQMLQLYCWDGVDAELRETIRGNVQDELSQPVADLKKPWEALGTVHATSWTI
jgi:hypothetical protein